MQKLIRQAEGENPKYQKCLKLFKYRRQRIHLLIKRESIKVQLQHRIHLPSLILKFYVTVAAVVEL